MSKQEEQPDEWDRLHKRQQADPATLKALQELDDLIASQAQQKQQGIPMSIRELRKIFGAGVIIGILLTLSSSYLVSVVWRVLQ